jgi:hypothetical protein
MKKLLRISLILVSILILMITGILIYASQFLPNVGPAPDISIDYTPERIERGKYLANHVMLCMDCHAQRDWSTFAGPPIPGTEGCGGEVFNQDFNFPGSFVARNLTPSAIGNWTDGELFRAITTGVSKDGSALFPIMPYPNFGKLDEEDIKSVIAYIRTLAPIDNTLPPSQADFPMNFIINTIPQKATLAPMPSKSDKIAYGKYMITASGCGDCHTKQEKGEFVGEFLAGGFEFKFPDGTILRSPNITMHETGIGRWTKELFVNRFKQYAAEDYVPHKVKPGQMQTVMPWTMYAGMETEDLEAIFEYIKSVTPVENKVERYTPGS